MSVAARPPLNVVRTGAERRCIRAADVEWHRATAPVLLRPAWQRYV